MGKKQKQPAQHHVVTKRQLARWQRDRRINRITLIVGGLIIVIILAVLGWGYHQKVYIPHQQDAAKLHQTVAAVNERNFDLEYFIDALHFISLQNPGQDVAGLADQLVPLIQNFQLVRAEAQGRSLQVGKAEIDKALKDSPLKKNRVARELVEDSLLGPKLSQALVDEKLPAAIPQIEVQAMLLGDDDAQYKEALQRVEAGEDFVTVAQELSVDILPPSKKGQALWFPLAPWGIAEPALDEALTKLDLGQLSQPIWDETAAKGGGYWVLQALPKSAEAEEDKTKESETEETEAKTVEVRAILTSTAKKAEELQRSIESGEDIEALAEEHSQHYTKYNGGLIKVTEGSEDMSKVFQDAAFALEPGRLRGEPLYDDTVSTEGGYWLLKTLNKEERPTDTVVPADWSAYLDTAFQAPAAEVEVRQLWESRLFSEWLTKAIENSILGNRWDDLDQETKNWAIARATPKTQAAG